MAECPKGSICQPTLGIFPKVVLSHLRPLQPQRATPIPCAADPVASVGFCTTYVHHILAANGADEQVANHTPPDRGVGADQPSLSIRDCQPRLAGPERRAAKAHMRSSLGCTPSNKADWS